jgi:hypothetical protein
MELPEEIERLLVLWIDFQRAAKLLLGGNRIIQALE